MIDRLKIVKAAQSLLKTPFKHQGRMPMVGVDCIGLLVCIANDLNIDHRDSLAYSRRPTIGSLRKGLENSGLIEIEIKDAGVGDVLAFWVKHRDRAQHVGLITDYGLIHTNADVGFVTEHILSDKMRDRIDSAWSFPGVEQ